MYSFTIVNVGEHTASSTPNLRHNAVVKRLEFDRWKKHEDKASSARVEAVSIKRGAKGEVRTAEGSLQSSEKNS